MYNFVYRNKFTQLFFTNFKISYFCRILYEFEIDLNDIEVIFPENIDNNIKITEESGILMKYPSASLYDDKEFLNLATYSIISGFVFVLQI